MVSKSKGQNVVRVIYESISCFGYFVGTDKPVRNLKLRATYVHEPREW